MNGDILNRNSYRKKAAARKAVAHWRDLFVSYFIQMISSQTEDSYTVHLDAANSSQEILF